MGQQWNLFNDELRKELNKAIETLPPRCKEVFTLSFLYEFSGKEISEKLGISVSTVENHINNALKILRTKLITHKDELLVLLLLWHFSWNIVFWLGAPLVLIVFKM